MKSRTVSISLVTIAVIMLLSTILTGCNKTHQLPGAVSSETAIQISGTWQTASMGYEFYGTLQPEYYVQFTSREIIYGHMRNGEFIPDHSDNIIHLTEISSGVFRIQAEASNGAHYTYLTSQNDHDVLEYYGTWKEEEFPTTYSMSASLGRVS